MTASQNRARTSGHAQASRGSRVDETPELPTNAETPEVADVPEVLTDEQQAQARAEALQATLSEHSGKDAVNALIAAHFDGSILKFVRSVLRSVDYDTRNRALFQRREVRNASGDVTQVTYELCGFSGTITRDASGKFRQDGFLMQARDASKNEFEKRFGDGSTLYDALDTPQKNMLAGFRNGILWILNERDTERKVSRGSVDAQALTDMERKLAEAEKRAKEAEARAETYAHLQASQAQSLEKILAMLDAQKSGS